MCRTLNNACEINSSKNSRTLCPPCRLQKCLDFGMQESLVKPINLAKPCKLSNAEQKYLESLLANYQACFPKDLLMMLQPKVEISAEFILRWNELTLSSVSKFTELCQEFQAFKECEIEVILLHNVKAMQFILMSTNATVEDVENVQPFLPLLTYNVIESRALMNILLDIQRLKLSEEQVCLSLIWCLFNLDNLPMKILDYRNTFNKIDRILKSTFYENWKWNLLSKCIKTLLFLTSSIYLKTKEFILN